MLESAWDFWKKMEKEVDASSGTKGNVYLYLSFTFGIHIFLNLDFSLDKGSQRPDSRRKMLRGLNYFPMMQIILLHCKFFGDFPKINSLREVNFKTHKDGEKESEVKTKIMNEGNTKVTKEEPDNNKTIKVEVESSQKQNKIEPNRSDVPESQIVENELGDDLIDAVKDENVDKVKR